ncbi:hypothetical protein [Bombilactobacillus bombi]|uniref:hypothetical protein n=1 Tax=Bombilactobacillus bombi TaxID=1303590 RepID=UPI0035EB6533
MRNKILNRFINILKKHEKNTSIIEYPEHYVDKFPLISGITTGYSKTEVLPYDFTDKKIILINQSGTLNLDKITNLGIALGVNIQSELSDDLDVLVIGNQGQAWETNLNDNSDLKYAEEHNIEVISECDFWLWCILELEVYQSEAFSYKFERELKHWQLKNDSKVSSVLVKD